jgi:hypothetical protein
MAEPPHVGLCVRKLVKLGGEVFDMKRLTVDDGPAGHEPASEGKSVGGVRNLTEMGDELELLVV